jgi:hypothetical protein
MATRGAIPMMTYRVLVPVEPGAMPGAPFRPVEFDGLNRHPDMATVPTIAVDGLDRGGVDDHAGAPLLRPAGRGPAIGSPAARARRTPRRERGSRRAHGGGPAGGGVAVARVAAPATW